MALLLLLFALCDVRTAENRHLRLVADRLGKDRPAFVEYLQTVHVTRAAREMSHLYLIDTREL